MAAFHANTGRVDGREVFQGIARKLLVVGSGLLFLALTSACSPTVRTTGSDAAMDSYSSCMDGASPTYCNNVGSGSGESYNQYTGSGSTTYGSSSYGSTGGAVGSSSPYYSNVGYPYQSSYPASSSPYYGSNQSYGVGPNYYNAERPDLNPDEESKAFRASYAAYLGTLPEADVQELQRQWAHAQ